MQDAIAGFESAPFWAQIAMAIFAALVAIAVVAPRVTKRKFRSRFDRLALELGQEPPTAGGWPVAFSMSSDGRVFEIRHDLRRPDSKGSSPRGPTGFLLLTVTRLTGTEWPTHSVEITRPEGRLSPLVSGKRPTGDQDFDERVMVVEDGVPVRAGWLDAATRQAILRFFDGQPPGLVWIRDGELQFIMQDPWSGADGPGLRSLLQKQAALATALERTAGAHGGV